MATILLVEDDVNLREIYAARLTAEKYRVVVASDGEEALAKSVKERPDLILLDVMMPRISGFDVLDIIRSTPETKNTKVVMLTALSQPSDQARGEQLGVNRYLIKSQITLEDVVDTVKEILDELANAPKPKKTEAETEAAEIETAVKSLEKLPIQKKEFVTPPKNDPGAKPGSIDGVSTPPNSSAPTSTS